MFLLRWTIGLGLLAFAAVGAFLLTYAGAFRAGYLAVDPAISRAQVMLLEGATWPQLVAVFIAIIFYAVVALRLFSRRRAFGIWLTAFALALGAWAWSKGSGFYDAALPPAAVMADYIIIAGNVVVGLILLWMDRGYLR